MIDPYRDDTDFEFNVWWIAIIIAIASPIYALLFTGSISLAR